VIASAGIRQVIDLRLDDETPDFDESAAVKSAGLGYRGLPIRGAGDLTLENARQLDRLIAEVGTSPTLIHCSSGNRVGALIALRSAWIQGQPVDIATAEGRRWGLKALEPAVRKILSEPSRVSMLMMGRHTLQVYGPGGPAPALKEAALAFSKAGLGNVVVTTGPTTEWKQKAHNDADLIVSGSEAMMSEFLSAFPDLDPTTVTPLYLRPAALLVRPGNPKRIQGIGSVLEPGIRILVVNGSGQAGLWEDVAGRLGDIHSVKALRRNIAAFAGTSGEAKRLWQIDPSIDVWLIWNIWQVSNPDLAELVDIEPQYRIYRDVGVAMTRRGQVESQAQAFVDFLSSAQGAAIFTKWGWATNSENTTH
jgi:accessory colonization factor AcfC